MMTHPILLSSALLLFAVSVASYSTAQRSYPDLADEGKPEWMQDQTEQANAKMREWDLSDDVQRSNQLQYEFDGYLNDDLTEEGQPGWMDKLIEKAKADNRKRSRLDEQKREGEEAVEGVISQLKEKLSTLGAKAKGATAGLVKIREKWSKFSVADRAVLTEALQNSVTNVQTMANLADDPLEAIKAGMTTISEFAALAGPKGAIVSEALSFVSGFLSVFGAEEEESVGEIVREQIDEALAKYKDESLKEDAAGIAHLFDASKYYVNSLSQNSQTLTVDQAHMLATNVPLYNGLKFLGKLMNVIEKHVSENQASDGLKTLEYIELYCKLASVKDVIMTQTVALLPDELAPNRNAMLAAMKGLRNLQKSQLKFLFEGDVKNNIMPFYDPIDYPATDHYLRVVLEVPNYERGPLNGTYCLAPRMGGRELELLTWSRKDSRLSVNGRPYIVLGDNGCFWRLVPHGKNLYTIRNMYECPDYDYCGRYVSFDSFEGSWTSKVDTRLAISLEAMLWEVYGSGYQKNIRTKYTCGSSDPKWCDMQLTGQFDKGDDVITYGLTKDNIGNIWVITKNNPRKT